MGKPRLIILVRHGQSEGNKNREIHQTIPDHRVKLTQEGWQQAYEAGRRLRTMLRADDTLHFFTSPYRRTRETTEGILATLTSDEHEPSAFKRSHIKVYEEPRLREQDFGNFQPCSAEMERMWQERADYGHFFYRIPNGESAADAYDRISGFNESLWRQFGEDDFASVCVLVTHGLMSRVFLMKWYHFSVEYFEDLRNIRHCEFLVMRKHHDGGKYVLDTKLRTWSDMKRDRAIAVAWEKKEAEEAGKKKASNKDCSKLDRAVGAVSAVVPVELRRRWGGCPNGCNHDKSFKIRKTLADLVRSDVVSDGGTASVGEDATPSDRTSDGGDDTPPRQMLSRTTTGSSNSGSHGDNGTIASRRLQDASTYLPTSKICVAKALEIDVTRSYEEAVSSPDGTPNFISLEKRLRGHVKNVKRLLPPAPDLDRKLQSLHVGRDFGGSYSGHNSQVASDVDSSEDDGARASRSATRALLRTTTLNKVVNAVGAASSTSSGHGPQRERDRSGMGRGTKANRLGDHPHSSEGEHDGDEADTEHDDDQHDADSFGGHEQDAPNDDHLERTTTTMKMREAEKDDKSIMGSVY